jgi:primosomal protein N' (replication factor Y)
LRIVAEKFDCPPLNAELRKFVAWVAHWCVAPPGMVLRMVLRAPGALDPPAPAEGIVHAGGLPQKMTKARAAVLALAKDGMAWTRSGLAHAAGVSGGVVDGLIGLGVLQTVAVPQPPVALAPDPDHRAAQLTPSQAAAAGELAATIRRGGYLATLLDGVTGSGKTEVYFEAVAEALRAGRQALILMPEIALTSSFLERFEQRFGAKPAEWHSEIAPKRRDLVWRQAAGGEIRVVVGARSALFLPFADLGLIVVDEEHDAAYKQEDRVFYNARDMAAVRASLHSIPVVFASATPSIESRHNAATGKFRRLHLPARYGEAALPQIRAIDLRRDPPARGKFLSPVLCEAVGQTLERREQALLFLNRRGYAPLTLCRVCGHRFECPNCSAWLVEHRFRRQLQCHHCGHGEPVPQACTQCGTLDHLAACGPGVERLAEEALGRWPEARIVVLSSDMAGAARMRAELEAVARGEADIVIGTQVVAKGHNFPLLACVGVVDADLGLANGDPRAAERTFQLLSQVTGRAGRDGRASLGFLQTWQPQHPVIAALVKGDAEAFYERETAQRQEAGLPPFGRLASLIVSADTRAEAEGHARALRAAAPASGDITLLGPAEAAMALVRGRHRFRLLAKAARKADLQGYLQRWLAAAPKERGGIRVQVDVDPQSFL